MVLESFFQNNRAKFLLNAMIVLDKKPVFGQNVFR